MSANWDDARRRQRLLTTVLDDVATSGDTGVLHRHPIGEVFGDVEEFLLAVHARWATAVLARTDAVLEVDPPDPRGALAAQLRELDGAFAGARLLLAAHAERPALAAAVERLRGRVLADLGVDLRDLPPAPRRQSSCLRTSVPFLGRRRVSSVG